MKILHLCNKVPYPAQDGSSIAMRSMAEALRQQNVELTIWALNTKKHRVSAKKIQNALPPGLSFRSFAVDTSIYWLGLLRNLITGDPYHVSRFYQPPMARALKLALKQQHYDRIILEGLNMTVYLPLLRQCSSARLVYRAHNVEHAIWQGHLHTEKQFLRRFYLKEQVRRLKHYEEQTWRSVDEILFITAEDQVQAQKSSAELPPSLVVPCGLNLDEYATLEEKEPEADLSYLAAFDWPPNQAGLEWFMEEVWPLVREERPKASFLLGGRHLPAHFYAWAEQGLQFYENVPDVAQFLARGRMSPVPLLAGSGMRIKVLENMALGRPMVSTHLGAEGFSCTSGQEILLADAPKAFAKAILLLLENAELRKKLALAARRKVEEAYSNEQLGKRLLSFFHSL